MIIYGQGKKLSTWVGFLPTVVVLWFFQNFVIFSNNFTISILFFCSIFEKEMSSLDVDVAVGWSYLKPWCWSHLKPGLKGVSTVAKRQFLCTSQDKLSGTFCFKDLIPKILTPGVVYKFKCELWIMQWIQIQRTY